MSSISIEVMVLYCSSILIGIFQKNYYILHMVREQSTKGNKSGSVLPGVQGRRTWLSPPGDPCRPVN